MSFPSVGTYLRLSRWHQWWCRYHKRRMLKHEHLAYTYIWCAGDAAKEQLAKETT